jgi:hypothetical protein
VHCFLSVTVPLYWHLSLILSFCLPVYLSIFIPVVLYVVFSFCICSSALSSLVIHRLQSLSYSGRFISHMTIIFDIVRILLCMYPFAGRQAHIPCSFLNSLLIVLVVILTEFSPLYPVLFFVYFLRINAWILSLRFILPEYYRHHLLCSASSHCPADVSISYFHALTA